jgi:hypothetical protein
MLYKVNGKPGIAQPPFARRGEFPIEQQAEAIRHEAGIGRAPFGDKVSGEHGAR